MSQGISNPQQSNMKFRITYTGIFLAVILGCALLTGLVSQTILSVLVLAASVGLFFTGQIHLAFPVMIFYYASFGNLAGMSVYRYYSLLLLAFALVKRSNIRLKKWQMAPMVIYIVYMLCVLCPDNLRRGIFAIVDILCVVLLINGFLGNAEGLKRFFTIYVITAFFAYITGTITQSSYTGLVEIGGEYVEISRNYATFEDPNYAGLFYSVGIFATMALKLFGPKLRALVVIGLSAILLTTLSITALLVNVLLWLIYLFAFRKIKPAVLICVLVVLAILVGLYQHGLKNPDTPVIGMFSYRVQDKLQALERNDISDLTTNRSEITTRHLQYFANQSIFRMLVGMNASGPLMVDQRISKVVAHNEYVDLLLNVGILGTIVYLSLFFARTWQCFKITRKTQDPYGSCIFMIKMVWMLYGLTLTMFGDYRFMMLFLM